MSKEEFLQLLDKYRNGSATQQEKNRFLALIDTYEAELASHLDEEMTSETFRLLGDDATGELIYAAIRLNKQEVHPLRSIPVYKRKWMQVAAAIALLLISSAVYYFVSNKSGNTSTEIVHTETDIEPGKAGALLTLADGSQLMLDTLGNGRIAGQEGIAATLKDGSLVYDGAGKINAFNTMSTPRGRQFQVTLPDGTRVWLNAASSVKYPTRFSDAERKVEITGEVYFEVAKDSRRPFRVQATDRAIIEVLGTHFNVNAYEDEADLNTTLLEGSIRVKNNAGQFVLKPGQQSQFSSKGNQLITADTEKVMAWKNGHFNFNGLRLKEAMRQLERWYDIEVVYEGNVQNVELFGELSRDISLSGMIQVLNDFDIHARIGENRRLIITP